MKPIVKLTMKNVRCFADATLPIDPRVTVVIGENGAGKTTVAEAMASLAYGDDEGLHEFPLRHGATAGEIALWTADKSGPVALWLHGGRHPRRQRLDDDPLLLAYGRYRRVYDSRHWEPGTPRQISIDDLASELYDAAPKRRTSTLMHPDSSKSAGFASPPLTVAIGRLVTTTGTEGWRRQKDAERAMTTPMNCNRTYHSVNRGCEKRVVVRFSRGKA